MSRYRETELSSKTPNWLPAIAYYDLAGTLNPNSGTSHNQLAVIAQHDEDHFGALYHLHRALAVEEPFPSAKKNMETEFKRIENAQRNIQMSRKASSLNNGQDESLSHTLRAKFVRLHALYFLNDDDVFQRQLEDELISAISSELEKPRANEDLTRISLVNLAAEYIAQERLQGILKSLYSTV